MSQVDYPVQVKEFARRCHDEFGYPVDRIRCSLQRRGYPRVSWSTIKRWVDPDYAEQANAKRRRGGIPGRSAKRVWKRRLERAHDLREAGLSFDAISKVLRLDLGLELTSDQLGYGLSLNGNAERWARKNLTPEKRAAGRDAD